MRKHLFNEHPMNLAVAMAKLLQADPVATAQVKEHISEERLLELLDLTPPTPEVIIRDLEDYELKDLVRERFSRAQLLQMVTEAA